MPAYRYYYNGTLKKNARVQLDGLEFQHLAKVMRAKVSDVVDLVNGQGQLASAEILELTKKHAHLEIITVTCETPSEHELILAQASPKMNRLEFILEKGTELGVTKFWIFPGYRSEKKEYSKNQLERLRNITIGAMKQSGRLFLPEIILKPALNKWDSLTVCSYFGDLSENAPRLKEVLGSESHLIFIGPEAGFTKDEEIKLRALGAKGVKLHSNILRTDTAAIAAIAILTS